VTAGFIEAGRSHMQQGALPFQALLVRNSLLAFQALRRSLRI
jgi:hypothetical protein